MERFVYRIIDANFNRAGEGLRLVEEFCRFALNSPALTGRARHLRHDLSAAVRRLGTGRLLAARDTLGDVGLEGEQASMDRRLTGGDCLAAAFRRLAEALRTLGEMVKTIDREAAGDIERLRYAAYTLEKDVVLFGDGLERFSRVRLYVMVPAGHGRVAGRLAEDCAAGGADCIQLRAKGLPDDGFMAAASDFVGACRGAGVLSIINDRVDVAVAAGADGVHLGAADLSVEHARKLQLSPLVIGATAHGLDELRAVCGQLPTYVSIGPVFSSPTKPTLEPTGLDYVRDACGRLAAAGIAHVAVGGITLENAQDVMAAGARALAVCSAVVKAADPAAACRRLKEKISAFYPD
jgi:thiamine-phosphate pyrophosphorylase